MVGDLGEGAANTCIPAGVGVGTLAAQLLRRRGGGGGGGDAERVRRERASRDAAAAEAARRRRGGAAAGDGGTERERGGAEAGRGGGGGRGASCDDGDSDPRSSASPPPLHPPLPPQPQPHVQQLVATHEERAVAAQRERWAVERWAAAGERACARRADDAVRAQATAAPPPHQPVVNLSICLNGVNSAGGVTTTAPAHPPPEAEAQSPSNAAARGAPFPPPQPQPQPSPQQQQEPQRPVGGRHWKLRLRDAALRALAVIVAWEVLRFRVTSTFCRRAARRAKAAQRHTLLGSVRDALSTLAAANNPQQRGRQRTMHLF